MVHRRAGLLQPLLEDPVRPGRVDADLGVLVLRCRLADPHGLVPAVHSRNRIGMHGKGQVLVHARVRPPDPLGIGIGGGVGLDTPNPAQRPLATLVVESGSGHELPLALVIVDLPAPHVVTAGHDSGLDSLGDPGLDHEMADLGFHPHQISRLHIDPTCVERVQP